MDIRKIEIPPLSASGSDGVRGELEAAAGALACETVAGDRAYEFGIDFRISLVDGEREPDLASIHLDIAGSSRPRPTR